MLLVGGSETAANVCEHEDGAEEEAVPRGGVVVGGESNKVSNKILNYIKKLSNIFKTHFITIGFARLTMSVTKRAAQGRKKNFPNC